MKTKQQRKAEKWKEYQKIVNPAWKEYQKIEALASKEYRKIRDSALKKYDKIRDPALEEYRKIEDSAYKEYQKIIDSALKEYEKIRKPAFEECEKKCKKIDDETEIEEDKSFIDEKITSFLMDNAKDMEKAIIQEIRDKFIEIEEGKIVWKQGFRVRLEEVKEVEERYNQKVDELKEKLKNKDLTKFNPFIDKICGDKK